MDNSHSTSDGCAVGNDLLDAREAARLLEQTRRKARRQFSTEPPLLSLLSALIVLVIYGAIWLSTRGQHPYRGPGLGTVGVAYLLAALSILVSVGVYVRARTGVKGRSRHDDGLAALPMVFAIVGVYVFDGALKHDGFSNAIVYGVFDAAAPWLVIGAVLAGEAAAKEDWWKLAAGITVIAVGVAGAFTGPINVWAVLAVGGCMLLLAQGGLRLRWSQRG